MWIRLKINEELNQNIAAAACNNYQYVRMRINGRAI
jgi:hypothetical protein